MGGIFGGVSDMLFGGAPGSTIDPSVYLSQLQGIQNQIGSLYANAPQSNVLGGQAFADIRNLLGPSANGGLSTPLMAQYNAGKFQNALNAETGSANVLSAMQGRGLANSSIAAQGLENQSMQETLANSGLLASLYGLQNQNTGQLAGMLGQGGMFDISQNLGLLNAHANALAGISNQYASFAGMGLDQQYKSAMAGYENAGNFANNLIGSGAMYMALK